MYEASVEITDSATGITIVYHLSNISLGILQEEVESVQVQLTKLSK